MVIFCFILFHTIKEKVCYKSISNIFMLISVFHFFNMEKKHASIFTDIVLKNFCKHGTPRSEKEPVLKVLKLSSNDLLHLSIFLRCLPAFSGSVCQTQ